MWLFTRQARSNERGEVFSSLSEEHIVCVCVCVCVCESVCVCLCVFMYEIEC